MLPYFLLLSLVAADSFLDALKSAEKSSFRSDLERTKDFATALNLASVRRARRYNESLSSGRLTVGPVAHTIYGDLVGVVGGNVTQFLGVPFAQAPVGPLRWRSPLPPLNWGNRTAQWFGPTCPQTEANTWAIFTGTSEDCLNLNVYAPSAAPPTAAGYPVMVFFYGGSFTYGSAGFPLYDGWFDVSLLENTIIVAANYRLGVLGFMAGDALRSESADGSVGTYGFQDQIAALKFIQATASAFGGDATRVTIFGESAGAASVTSHLVGPKSAGFFSRAIIESGAFSVWTAQPWNISRTRLSQFSANVGCTSAPDLMGCLRALNTTEILKGDRGLTSGFLEWSPTIDGVYVLDDPRLLLKAGKAADVPVMMGFNADEGSLFVRAPKDLNESGYQGAIASILNPQLAAKVADFYPCKNYKADLGQSDCWWALAAIERDCMFACPVQTSAAILAQQSGRVNAAHTYACKLFIRSPSKILLFSCVPSVSLLHQQPLIFST